MVTFYIIHTFKTFFYFLSLVGINKFTKKFRKPQNYIDNNELLDYLSRLPSKTELVSVPGELRKLELKFYHFKFMYREFKVYTADQLSQNSNPVERKFSKKKKS